MVRAIVEYSPFAKAMADYYREHTKETIRVDSSDDGEIGDYQERIENLLSSKDFFKHYVENIIEICDELMEFDEFYVTYMLECEEPIVQFLALLLREFYKDNPSIYLVQMVVPLDLNGNVVFIYGEG